MAETITTTGTGGLYSNYCANRLPCGICRIMMCQCPVFNGCGIQPIPTWNPNEVTCKVEEDFNNETNSHVGWIHSEEPLPPINLDFSLNKLFPEEEEK